MKARLQIILGSLSLIALLIYTLQHTGSLLAHYVEPVAIGYIAAFGIEAAVVSLSLRIGDLRRSNKNTTFFLAVLVAVVIVSALANIAEGFRTIQGEPLTLTNIQKLDVAQAIIGLSATGLISLIVLALSEIIGTDVNLAVQIAERERKASERALTRQTLSQPTNAQPELSTDEQTPSVKANSGSPDKQQTIDALLNILTQQPNIPVTELAKAVGRSRTTVYSYLDELEQAGRLQRDNDGIHIIQEETVNAQ